MRSRGHIPLPAVLLRRHPNFAAGHWRPAERSSGGVASPDKFTTRFHTPLRPRNLGAGAAAPYRGFVACGATDLRFVAPYRRRSGMHAPPVWATARLPSAGTSPPKTLRAKGMCPLRTFTAVRSTEVTRNSGIPKVDANAHAGLSLPGVYFVPAFRPEPSSAGSPETRSHASTPSSSARMCAGSISSSTISGGITFLPLAAPTTWRGRDDCRSGSPARP